MTIVPFPPDPITFLNFHSISLPLFLPRQSGRRLEQPTRPRSSAAAPSDHSTASPAPPYHHTSTATRKAIREFGPLLLKNTSATSKRQRSPLYPLKSPHYKRRLGHQRDAALVLPTTTNKDTLWEYPDDLNPVCVTIQFVMQSGLPHKPD